MPFTFEISTIMKRGIIAIALFATMNIHAQDISNYTPGITDEGVVYFLPKSLLEIKVTATKVTYTPGELCQYADRYLRIQGISATPNELWEIKDIEVNSIGVPDKEKVYAIKLKDKTVTSQVELTEDGIIKAINTTSPDEKKAPTAKPAAKPQRVDPRSFMTEEILLAGSSNKMAELIAREIYNIRESKSSLTRGQADYMPQDGEALKIMLNNLDIQEKAYTEMFAGYTDYQDQVFTFHVDPSKEITEEVIFRFSNKLGVVESNNLAGEPIYLSLSNESKLPAADEEGKQKKKLEGVIYNIPGTGKVSIDSMNKNFCEEELPITQFGETEELTKSLFNKKINTRVIFNPSTGGIKKIDKD